MKTALIKALLFGAIIAGLGATAQAEDLPRDQQAASSKTMILPQFAGHPDKRFNTAIRGEGNGKESGNKADAQSA